MPITKKKKASKVTPLMHQYKQIKSKYPDAILLFRMGDFYETFGPDAVITSKVLGIVLTKRSNGAAAEVDLAGFPHHALDTYLPKLVKAGYRVAICDQLEDPKLTKTIVKRGVTELVTPGITLNDRILDHKSNNFLASVHFGDPMGIALLDMSTGEFLTAEGDKEYIDKLLQSFRPAEVIFSRNHQKDFKQFFGTKFYIYSLEDWIFSSEFGHEKLLTQFGTSSLKGFGLDGLTAAIIAAGSILYYLGETEHPKRDHITSISRLPRDEYVWLDRFTIRNLELLSSPFDGGVPLINILDQSISPMGSRMMKQWLMLPLKNKDSIKQRLNIVEFLIKNPALRDVLSGKIRQTGDLERLVSKVSIGRINPREVAQLGKGLQALVPICEALQQSGQTELVQLADQINVCEKLEEKIQAELQDDPPVQVQKGAVIARGVSSELDELRDIIHHGKEKLISLQDQEILKTGINTLKIGFNNVFGYYLEVTNSHKSKVPADWIRKQTLVNAERYITPELKEYESRIMGAEEKILKLEAALFDHLVNAIRDYIPLIQADARIIARLDCLMSFAHIALKNEYTRPLIDESLDLEIRAGRHPVIEQQMPSGEQYVPNDIFLSNEDQQIIVITGPNMSGKSALLRQTALIVLMAQMGCFVPAKSARIGLVDKIFTRVGASDNISSGESTFMVEMNETASIMNNISERSLILLDEIGRGTSTFDGISIAWSLAEFLHNHSGFHPKTLFATHYHELNELADKFQRIRNFNVSVMEAGQKVLFLRTLKPGGSQHSFGIHVAKMAGMPASIVKRADEILAQLEQQSLTGSLGAEQHRMKNRLHQMPEQKLQLSMFQNADPKLEELKALIEQMDVNTLTPLEALMKLNELKEILKKR